MFGRDDGAWQAIRIQRFERRTMERNVMKGWVPRFPFNSRTTINRATMFKGPSVEFRRTSDNGFRFIEELERIFVVFEGDGDTQRMACVS